MVDIQMFLSEGTCPAPLVFLNPTGFVRCVMRRPPVKCQIYPTQYHQELELIHKR